MGECWPSSPTGVWSTSHERHQGLGANVTRITRPRSVWLLAVAAVVLVVLAWSAAPTDEVRGGDVTVLRDLRYDSQPGSSPERNALDVYLPVGPDQYPFVLFLHGGGWVSGDKNMGPSEPYENVGQALASRGIGVAIANYRLSDGSESHVVHPGHVEDVVSALAFVRAFLNSRGVDPSDMFVGGHDAGAHLASLMATNGRYLAAAGLSTADLRGVIGLSGIYRVDPVSSEWAVAFGEDPEVRRDASPIDHVGSGAPPFLLTHADGDLPGREDEALSLAAALRSAGVEAGDHRIADRDHDTIAASIGELGDVTTALILHFVHSHVERTPTPTRTPSPTPIATAVPTATSGPAAQPLRPASGPGGADRPHASAVQQLVERDGSRLLLVEPREPQPASAPVVVFLGADDHLEQSSYGAWLTHIARGGAIAVQPDYGVDSVSDPDELADAVEAAYRAALAELTESADQHPSPLEGELAWVGHGRGAIVAGDLAASWFRRRLPSPSALMMLTPRRLGAPVSVDRTVPRDTMTLLVLAEDDPGGDADLESDIWRALEEIPAPGDRA